MVVVIVAVVMVTVVVVASHMEEETVIKVRHNLIGISEESETTRSLEMRHAVNQSNRIG